MSLRLLIFSADKKSSRYPIGHLRQAQGKMNRNSFFLTILMVLG